MSDHGDHDEVGHVVPEGFFWQIFGALFVLTLITVAAAFQDFGMLNMVVAMGIASVKAGLVALFFMHLKYEDWLTWLYVFFPIFLLFLMIGLIFIDNPYRTM